MSKVSLVKPDFITRTALEIWTTKGIPCATRLGGMAGMNGYGQLPAGSPHRAGDHDDIHLLVHGGLTYGPDESGWIGFDTGHAFDVWRREEILKVKRFMADRPEAWKGWLKRWDCLSERLTAPFDNARYKNDNIIWTYERLKIETTDLAVQVAGLRS